MAGIKIPGAESIENVAPAHDPGVTASPDAFGAQIGTAEQHFGDSLSSLGALLYKKRQAAEDQTYEQTYNVNVAPELQRAQQDLQKKYPNGGPEYEQAADSAYMNVHATVKQKLADMGLKPSDSASKAVDTSFNGRFTNLRVGAVAYNNNASIAKLQGVNLQNTDALASQVMSGAVSPDDALKQFDAIADASTQLYGGKDFETFKKNGRDTIMQAAVDKEIAAKNPDKARELNARYFGGVPRPGQSSADTLIRSESGGNPSLVNQYGFAGTYQFGAPRLDDLGVYTPGPNENLDTWNKTGKSAPGKWTGTFNIEGFPQVKTIRDFLANPDAQKAVFDEHMSDIDEQSTKLGLDKYVGQSVGGIPITQAGIRNMAHLGGIGGAEQFLKTGGRYNVPDANGTTLAKYAAMGAANPSVGRSLANNNKIDSMDAVNRQDTQEAIKDDLASTMATGKGNPDLTAEQITRSLGPNAAADWGTAKLRAVAFHDNTQDFATLPADQMNARLIALAPKPGQEEYLAQDALHTMAVKKADEIMALRAKDPAESVSDDPEVKKAIAAFGAKPDDVGLQKAVIGARLAAQQRAGIVAPSPLPVDETQRLLKPLNEAIQMEALDRTKNAPDRVYLAQKQLSADLKAKYGSYADDVMREVIGQAMSARDRLALADAAGKVVTSLLNGDQPDPREARRLAREQEAARIAQINTNIARVNTPTPYTVPDIDGVVPASVATPTPPPVPSADKIQILLNAPENDKARLAGLFDKKYGAGSSAKYLNANTTEPPKGVVNVDGSGEGWKPE